MGWKADGVSFHMPKQLHKTSMLLCNTWQCVMSARANSRSHLRNHVSFGNHLSSRMCKVGVIWNCIYDSCFTTDCRWTPPSRICNPQNDVTDAKRKYEKKMGNDDCVMCYGYGLLCVCLVRLSVCVKLDPRLPTCASPPRTRSN